MVPRRTGLGFATALMASLFAAGAASTALAHESAPPTVQSHVAEDSVVHDPAAERELGRNTREATASDAQAAEAMVVGNESEVGQWGPVANWPVVGIHAALLENGKVLAYDTVNDSQTGTHDHTRATVWDPATGAQTPVNVVTGYNVFCSGLAHLPDGSIFLAGGNKNVQLDGIVQTHIFDSDTNSWTLGPNMAAERWYPSVTPLSNGEMLITSGRPDMPEVRRTDGSLRVLNAASLDLPLYPWMDVAPNGRTFYSGPDETMRSLNTAGAGSWEEFGQRDQIYRDYGSRALYDVGRILVAGGGNSSRDARVINLNGAAPQVSATGEMAFGRRQHNLTVLADGTVLATGGNSSGAPLVDMNNGVYAAELWNPATGTWTTLATEQVTRQYHSTALLLPDGRVLSAGGGICGDCDQAGYLARNAQVLTPPYLYKKDGSGQLAPRPQITSAPAEIPHNAPFWISTPNPAAIGKVALVRLGAVTHSVNMEQRYVPLSFTAEAGTVKATSPANANVAPPGVYMLFVIGTDGVPSMATMVRVGSGPIPNRPPAVRLTAPSDGATPAWDAAITIAADASDRDGSVQKVEFFANGQKLGEDQSGPYRYDWTSAGSGTHTLTATVTDNTGDATTSAPVHITVSPFAPLPSRGGDIASGAVERLNRSTPFGPVGPSAWPGADTLDPSVSRFAFAPRRFRVASHATAVDVRAGQPRRRRAATGGSRMRFSLSEQADVRVLIERVDVGRKLGRRCKPQSRNMRWRGRCTRFKRVGIVTRRDRAAGRNMIPFSGDIGGRALAAGGYRATISATDAAGNRSAPRRASFTILRF
jgi:hypothetical protein